MFTEIVLFEIKYRLKRVSTYVYFGIWFALALVLVSHSTIPGSLGGKVYANSPYQIFDQFAQIMALGIVVISAIFGTSILRDFQENTYELFFTKPIRKSCYLGGRLLGSALVCVLIFSSLPVGSLTGSVMPWADKSSFMPVHCWFYLQPFLLVAVTQILFTGALFFSVGALTRSLVAVYLQGILFLSVFLMAAEFLVDNANPTWSYLGALLDPLGLQTEKYLTKYWTIAEKNSLVVPFAGVMAYNRLLWLGVGALSLAVTFRFFPFSAEVVARKRFAQAPPGGPTETEASSASFTLPLGRMEFGPRARFAQFLGLTRLRAGNILTSVPFVILALLMVGLCVLDGRMTGTGSGTGTPVYPVTYLMVSILDSALLYLIVIATLYAGELVWKERDLRFDPIQDALPIPNYLSFASMISALTLMFIALTAITILIGIVLQASMGYYRFELPLYLKETFLLKLPLLLQYSAAALFVQTVLRNKFLGHTLIIGWFLLTEVLASYGYIDCLYTFGATPSYTYSDMNGYGHFARPLFWFKAYWTALAMVLAVLAILLTPRGTDQNWRARFRQAREQFRFPLTTLSVVSVAAFIACGGYIFYNTHLLNHFESEKAYLDRSEHYEKRYKQYQKLPKPKIRAIEMSVDIFPQRRAFQARGTYVLTNEAETPIADIHVSDLRRVLQRVNFDRPYQETLKDTEVGYRIYHLARPLLPGENMTLNFTSGYAAQGFLNHGEKTEFAYNGTFFNEEYFPEIGYSGRGEIGDDDRRKKRNLPPKPDMPLPGTIPASQLASKGVRFKATVSTAPDQIAIAPGHLEREWTEKGRRYFLYDLGTNAVPNAFCFLSGRYAVKRDRWQDIPIEVFYHPGHEYNVAHMIEATQKGFDYFTTNFGPYRYREFRIIEFPRYQNSALAYPNTIPYSESVGFIARASQEEDLDQTFYTTAHELAHQWWGQQVRGYWAQGSRFLTETLAQYSALMVMDKELGPANIRAYLKHELDKYLSGRSGERNKEAPLYLASWQNYVFYHKGSLVMYALQDYLGEERLNAALRKFLEAVKLREPPCSDTVELLKYIREVTPADLQSVVTDLFETITLFDNRAVEASYRETPTISIW